MYLNETKCVPDGRLMLDGSYAATTWEVQFKLTEVRSGSSPYKLRIATASANGAAILVTNSTCWIFFTGLISSYMS